MTRIHAGLMGVAAAVALTAGAAKAQSYYDTSYDPDGAYTAGEITVYAPRVYHDQSRPGSPEEIVRESRLVRADDLDLATGWGARTLRERIERAAHDACGHLGDRYMAVDSGRDCVRVAVRNAMFEVEDRLASPHRAGPTSGRARARLTVPV